MKSQGKLYHINQEFNIFNDNVTKILDLGYSPGNWLEFSKLKMCEAHGVEENDINKKCHFLGFDILVGYPPAGTSTIQGNIFSKSSHYQIIDHFKQLAIKQQLNSDEDVSYFTKEQTDVDDIEHLEQRLQKMHLSENFDYKPELILSDLSAPFLQEKGTYHNTQTKPHMRFANNPVLNLPILKGEKSSIDMADATLILALDVLKKHGNLVIRLATIDSEDPELDILNDRLNKVFNTVEERQFNDKNEIFFICLNKKRDTDDKSKIFTK